MFAKRDFNERFCDLLHSGVPAARAVTTACEIRGFVVGDSFHEFFFIENEYAKCAELSRYARASLNLSRMTIARIRSLMS